MKTLSSIITKPKRLVEAVLNRLRLRANGVVFGRLHINGLLYVSNKGGHISIGHDFSANAGKNANPIGGDTALRLIVFRPGAELTIGQGVGISNSTIVCWEKITIGNHVIIGGGCKIWDTNFHSLDPLTRVSGHDTDVRTSPVVIEDYAFIGGGVTILKGVRIGQNAIVAAGSVVYEDVPANAIAGGNPCKVIRMR